MNTFLKKVFGISNVVNKDFNKNQKLLKEILEKDIIEESLEFNQKDVSIFENSESSN